VSRRAARPEPGLADEQRFRPAAHSDWWAPENGATAMRSRREIRRVTTVGLRQRGISSHDGHKSRRWPHDLAHDAVGPDVEARAVLVPIAVDVNHGGVSGLRLRPGVNPACRVVNDPTTGLSATGREPELMTRLNELAGVLLQDEGNGSLIGMNGLA
jgi:hypothetical protein